MKYAFIDAHVALYPVRRLCSTLAVHPSGYCAWKQQPISERSANDQRVGALIAQCREASGRVHGYRKIRNDLHDMGERMTRDLALNALPMAVWRRKPTQAVLVHSDQGSQFSSHDWQDFLKAHRLVPSMSRRGNCHGNAVAESFFQLIKRERIKRKIHTDRAQARSDVLDYIELFYNPRRRHGFTNPLSPVEFERQYFLKGGTV